MYTVKNLLDIARTEIGYCEKETNSQLDDKTANAGDNNWTKYARDLAAAGYYQANKNGYAWCDMFVDWLFLQLCGGDATRAQDIICQTGLYGAGCSWSAKYYKQQDRFYSDPQPGDQIFFGPSGAETHTGVVENVENGTVTTIEGNTSNKVARRSYKVGDSNISGYGRPKYDEEKELSSSTTATVTGTPSTSADAKAMYDYLVGKGLNAIGASVVLGQFDAECGLKSNNLQNTGNTKLNLTDEEYTAEIDAGSRNFEDSHGYGLAQWTYYTRKRALLAFVKEAKKSVGDWKVQLDFFLKEVQGYKAVYEALKTGTNIKTVSDLFMVKYEAPADQSDKAKDKRASYCQKYYDKYATSTKTDTSATADATKTVEQVAKEVINGKWGNGTERKQKLTAAGYDYATVQEKVNELLTGKTVSSKKSVDEVANEVIQGKWGNGAERKQKLTAAGYDYEAVQKRVNKLLG